MTKDTMDLRALLEKNADADLLRDMIGFAAERLMELEVGAKTGAEYGEKSAERTAQRNGYRDREWRTRAGDVELRIPPLRTGSYFPSLLEPRRAVEKALSRSATSCRSPRPPILIVWPSAPTRRGFPTVRAGMRRCRPSRYPQRSRT